MISLALQGKTNKNELRQMYKHTDIYVSVAKSLENTEDTHQTQGSTVVIVLHLVVFDS